MKDWYDEYDGDNGTALTDTITTDLLQSSPTTSERLCAAMQTTSNTSNAPLSSDLTGRKINSICQESRKALLRLSKKFRDAEGGVPYKYIYTANSIIN